MNVGRPRRRIPQRPFGLAFVGGTLVTAAALYGAYRVASAVFEDGEEEQDGGEAEADEVGQRADPVAVTATANDRNKPLKDWVSQTAGAVTSSVRWLTETSTTAITAVAAADPSQLYNGRRSNKDAWKLKRAQFIKCKEEVINASLNLFPTAMMTIEQSTNTSKTTKALKRLRAKKMKLKEEGADESKSELENLEKDLWDTIKVETATRLIATMFAHMSLFLVLTTQMHLYTRNMAQQVRDNEHTGNNDMGINSSNADDEIGNSNTSAHRLMLARTYDVFFDTGIAKLIVTVRRSVSRHMGEWNVLDPSTMNVTEDDLRQTLQAIIDEVLYGTYVKRSRGKRPRSPVRFFISPDDDEAEITNGMNGSFSNDATATDRADVNDPCTPRKKSDAQLMQDETWDIVDSPIVEDAQLECLKVTSQIMFQRLGKAFGTIADGDENGDSVQRQQALPLATIIAHLKNTTLGMYDDQVELESMTNGLVMLSSVQELNTISFD